MEYGVAMAYSSESMRDGMTEAPRDLPFFPDFFIIGAPRCGTTSLSTYLRKHPRICFSRPKEPHYFTKLAPAFGLAGIRDMYLRRCFANYDPAVHEAIGEGSVSYIYSVEAIEAILSFNPRARFIVMLRNPLEMLPSFHSRMFFILQEDEPSFARAWELQEARARGEHLPRHCLDPELLRYSDIARYAALLRRLFSMVERERCLVLLFDDFTRDPRGVYERTLAFLGVPSDGRSVFPTRQPSRTYRYAWVQRLLYPPLGDVIRFAAEVERRAAKRRGAPPRAVESRRKTGVRRSLLKRLRKRVKDWNTIRVKPEPLSPQLRDTLCAAFAADVEDLGMLLQRDVSHWLQPAAAKSPAEPSLARLAS